MTAGSDVVMALSLNRYIRYTADYTDEGINGFQHDPGPVAARGRAAAARIRRPDRLDAGDLRARRRTGSDALPPFRQQAGPDRHRHPARLRAVRGARPPR